MSSASRRRTATCYGDSPRIPAEALRLVREPLRWQLDWGRRVQPPEVLPGLRRAALGPCDADWSPPGWLLAHQVTAARCLAGRLALFRGAILADAVGLGKTYVALAVATRYAAPAGLVPAALVPQWRRVMEALDLRLPLVSHEALSRGAVLPPADLIVVDEAHRFRNPETRRYDALARAAPGRRLLLLTATPVVNQMADLVNLLRLWLSDHGLAALGVPSLGGALAARATEALAHACAALIVARSPEAVRVQLPPMPDIHDARVLAPATLPPHLQPCVAAGIAALEFPSFGDRQAAELLRLHLWHRLASSPPAFRESLRRHTAYLDRAIAAAERGERLSRAAVRSLFGADEDGQLELCGLESTAPRLDAAALRAERARVQQQRTWLRGAAIRDPKAEALEAILAERAGGKTLVFTSAVVTAGYLASRAGWRRVCTASGRGARIASGAIGLEQALALFAPAAQQAAAPPPTLLIDTLIATDLLSEGLDLQDADAVVHYDLPWTPLRLEQRLGRIARLGSRHGRVCVWWFRPCEALEARLALARRLSLKADGQLRLGVTTSGIVGRARILGGLYDWRARFGALDRGPAPAPRFAVVRGPAVAAFALRWTVRGCPVPELLVLAGHPPAPVENEQTMAPLVQRLACAPSSAASPPPQLVDGLRAAVRQRLAAAMRAPCDDETRRLARRVLRRAAVAARARELPLLRLLDAVLDRLAGGLSVGPLRALEDALAGGLRPARLQRWLRGTVRLPGEYVLVALDAALLGDGTLTESP